MKKLLLIFLISGMLLFAGCTNRDHGDVIGLVNGQKIYQDEMEYYFAYYYTYYYENYYSYFQQYMGIDLLNEESARDTLGDFEKSAWEASVKSVLIEQIAAGYGITYEDNYLQDLLPWGDYRTIKVGTLNSQLFEAVKQEMLDNMEISEEQVRAAYDADPALWDGRATSQIFIKCNIDDPEDLAAARAKAKEVLGKLNGGADFAELAAEYSDDASADSGGVIDAYINSYGNEVGTENGYYEEYVAGVYSLAAVGDYTVEPVLSSAGYHIIKLDDIRAGYDNVKGIVAESLKTVSDEDVSARVNEIIDEAYAAADIKQKFKFKYYVEETDKEEAGAITDNEGITEDETTVEEDETKTSDNGRDAAAASSDQ